MAKITQSTQFLFGSAAGANQMTQFGSLAAGTFVAYSGSATPAQIQGVSGGSPSTQYTDGWYSAIVGSNSPTIQDINSLFALSSYQLSYLFQEGIPEYDSGTTYYQWSVCQSSGVIYQYINSTGSAGNAPPNATYWALMNSFVSNQASSTYAVAVTDGTICLSTASNSITATLPTASGIGGKVYRFILTAATSGYIVTLNTTSSQSIGGYSSGVIQMGTPNDSISVVSDGSNWQILDYNISVYSEYYGCANTPNSTPSILNFGGKYSDALSCVTTGSSWKFTCPISGKYQVSSTIGLTAGSAADAYLTCYIYKNSSQFAILASSVTTTGSTEAEYASGSKTMLLTAGDTISLEGTSNSGFALVNTQVGTWVTIERIGN